VRIYLPEGGLGDAAAVTAAVREFHREHPEEPVHVNTMHRYDDLYRWNPHLRERPEGGRAVVLELERDGALGNIPMSFCRQLGVRCLNSTPEVYLLPSEEAGGSARLGSPVDRRRLVAVDVWARAESRTWRLERWEELVSRLAREGYLVVELGRRVATYTHRREKRATSAPLNLVGQLSIRETLAVLKVCALFIGTDSGSSHLAAAVGTPQVVLYSRSPWYSRAYWNTTPVLGSRHPCPRLCDRECSESFFCLDEITPNHVHAAALLALSRFPKEP